MAGKGGDILEKRGRGGGGGSPSKEVLEGCINHSAPPPFSRRGMWLTKGFFSIFFKFSAFIASALTFKIALVLQKNYLALLAL